MNRFTLFAIITVVTGCDITVIIPTFDPQIFICGGKLDKETMTYKNGLCFQSDDEWSLWIGSRNTVYI